jgi:hypothetical protein
MSLIRTMAGFLRNSHPNPHEPLTASVHTGWPIKNDPIDQSTSSLE